MSLSNRTTTPLFAWALLALAVVGATHTIFRDGGLLTWLELRRDLTRLEEENRVLREENERMRTESHRLTHDPRHLERVVREDLGYVRPDEIVFRFDAPATTQTPRVKR